MWNNDIDPVNKNIFLKWMLLEVKSVVDPRQCIFNFRGKSMEHRLETQNKTFFIKFDRRELIT